MTKVYVGIGSNIDRDNSIRGGVAALDRLYGPLILSSVYESRAYGFEGDNFYNLVAGFETDHSLDQLSQNLRQIEIEFGRSRDQQHFQSRTLDLDLLLYGDAISPEHDVPREDITRYAFVLCPLAEIAPDKKHPQRDDTYTEMWQSFENHNQPVRRVDFELPVS